MVAVKRYVRRRHKFTLAQQLKGTEGALKSPKTPKHLKVSLEKRRRQLLRKMKR